MPSEIPSDFDWVTARHKCSALQVFERLKMAAERNVSTMNVLAQERGLRGGFEFAADGGDFSVCRITHKGVVGVRFKLQAAEDRISIYGDGVNVGFMAGLTLNNDGECRLVVDKQKLDVWQVMRQALEPLFFGILP